MADDELTKKPMLRMFTADGSTEGVTDDPESLDLWVEISTKLMGLLKSGWSAKSYAVQDRIGEGGRRRVVIELEKEDAQCLSDPSIHF